MKFESPERPSEAELAAKSMVQIWAEAVVRQAARARTIRKKDDTDFRNHERGEDWSDALKDELGPNWRTRWAEEHTLVWSAHQLEQWTIRLANIRGEDPPAVNENLKNVRDALEHLNEVDLTETTASAPSPQRKKDPRGRSLREHFPNETLVLGLGGQTLFHFLDPEALDKSAVEILRKVREDLDVERLRQEEAEVSAYVDMLMER
ncbi:hypothetical protein [Streptomyces sp. NPDC048157]|uniref:hypothetical protein n=1 Tax=Streptomyces sp. NPDC048157 TaxID=3365503 RepID=UPI0037141B02